EDGKSELAAYALRQFDRGPPGPVPVAGLERNDRDDVGRSDKGVNAFVRPEVDAITGAADRCDERLDEMFFVAHQREDRAVVVAIRMHVEHAAVGRQRLSDRVDRGLVTPLREVGNGLEGGGHGAYSRSP